VGEIVPHSVEEHTTDHVTPRFAVSPVTVAVNDAVVPAGTVAGAAEIATVTRGAPGIVTVAEPVAEAAAMAAATI